MPAGTTAKILLRFDAFVLDEAEARLLRDGAPVALPPKAFAVLCALACDAGRLVSKETLLDRAWGHQHVSESVLKTTISQLRSALGDDVRQPRYIETASRRGYRFIGSTALSPTVAPAPLGVSTSNGGIVGRAPALARLRAAWAAAQQGRRQILWVAGEPGVGKTTLIDTFIAELGDAAVAVGQCVEPFGSGEPYLPVLDALGTLCRRDPALVPLMRQVAPTWLLQLPWLTAESERGALQREVAGASQDRMLRELGELLDRCTAERPLLLVTEDLHWGDHATVRLLDHVARRRAPARLLWLGSMRLAELVAGEHPFKGVRQELRAHRLGEELPLEPFSESELAEYLAGRFPAANVRESFVQALHARTDGLPLFVANVVDDLFAQGGPALLATEALGSHWSVPESLAGVIERQIERLEADQQRLLGAASACGMQFTADIAAAALQRDEAWVQDLCDRLSRQWGWLDALAVTRRADGSLETPYAFRHSLYRHVFYQRQGAAARADAHRRIGAALLRRRAAGGDVAAAELAMHFEAGRESAAAVVHCLEAAASAMGHFAPLEAAQHADHGLALLAHLPAGPERLERELSLATLRGVAATQLTGVASPQAVASLARARELCELLPDTPERAWVQNGLGWIHYTRGEFADARALAARIDRLAQACGDRMLRVCACNLLGVTAANDGDQRESRRWLEEGLDLVFEAGAGLAVTPFVVDPEVSMRANLCLPLRYLGLTEAARRQWQLAIARAEALGQPMAQMLAFWCGCMLQISLQDARTLREQAQALAAVVERHAVAQGEGPSLWYRGWAEAQLGDAHAGHRMIMEGYERHARFGMLAGCPLVLGHAAEALAMAGDLEGARRQFDDALALARRIGERVTVADLLLRRAQAEGRAGANAEARAALTEALAAARASGAQGLEVDALIGLAREGSHGKELSAVVASLPPDFDAPRRAAALQALGRA